MYLHNIKFAVFGAYEPLMKILETADPGERMAIAASCGAGYDPRLAAEADVIIFNGPGDFAAARADAKEGAYLVACLSASEEKNLSEADKELLDDLWQAPLSEYRLRARLARLLAEIAGNDSSAFLAGCLDTFINSLPDMVWFKDLEGVHRKVNDYFCEFVNKPREEVESATHEDIWGAPEADGEYNCHETDQAAIDSGETVMAEEVVETDTGKRLFKTIKTPIRGLEGEILGTVGIARDISNMLKLNMELALFIEMMPFPLMICDIEDRIVNANAKFIEFFETSMAQTLELDWRDWYERNIQHDISPTGEDIYRRFARADGRVSFLKMISHEMNDLFGNYQGVIHVFEDVTQDKEMEYNIWRLANTDALTGIANRQAFYEYAKRINKNERIHLFYVDLDNFKQVNDVYGHKAGDEALKVTASILRQVFEKDFPARLGGDEFIVLSRREAPPEEIEALAQSLIDQLKAGFAASESLSALSCSIGVAFNASMSEGIEPIIKAADSAMYDAKKKGKARFSVYGRG